MSQQHTKTIEMELPPGIGALDGANNRPFEITAYEIVDTTGWTLTPAPVQRDWMEIDNGFAYRCLPLTMANSAGWVIGCPVSFVATWSGSPAKGTMRLDCDEPILKHMRGITDHFGNGIVTFNLPWQFGTNRPGVGLRVSGLPNAPKFNTTPLEGFVETDWLPFTFTMNWKIQRPKITDDPQRQAAFEKWDKIRRTFNADPCRKPEDWQRMYHKAAEAVPGKHRTSIKAQPFATETPPSGEV
jgi:hypothetical protein